MAIVDRRLVVFLLAILTPSLGTERCDLEPEALNIKAGDIGTILQLAANNFQPVFDVTDGRCPCLDESDLSCFENQLRQVTSMLDELSAQVANLTAIGTEECPPLEGCAALVASDVSPDIAVADPVGTILQSIDVNSNISAFIVGERNVDESFSLYFISNEPFVVKRLDYPSLAETTLANASDLAQPTGIGKGITICGNVLYVTVDYCEDGVSNVILSIDLSTLDVATVTTVSCTPGTIRAFNGRLFYVNCKNIESINKTGGDLQTEFKFPVNINSFDVIGNDRLVTCESAGGLWTHNSNNGCSKLLSCEDSACGDVKISPCSSLIYVAYPNDEYLDIFNSTTCDSVGQLQYTVSAPTGSPSLGFEPACLP